MFLEQNSPYFCQKPRKAPALLHFLLQYKKFSVLTKLRSTLASEKNVQEKAKAADNADAYRRFLTHYCAIFSFAKEKLPYQQAAYASALDFFMLIENLSVLDLRIPTSDLLHQLCDAVNQLFCLFPAKAWVCNGAAGNFICPDFLRTVH